MKKIISTIAAMLFFFVIAFSQEQTSASDIYLQIKKLNVLGSVLYWAAHPDDENNLLLTYLSKDKLYRTAYLSLTRGDGGQNLIGDEQGFELGLIRTQELLAARRKDGAAQLFSSAYDFGFSKTTEEALRNWGHEKLLSDAVWIIRKYQPDVIITRFPPDARAGHGHHSASAVLAREAFTAAADSTKFPEQLKLGVTVWQAKRLLWNTYSFGNTNTTNDRQFKIETGGYNSLLGESYGEIAAESRSSHKTQGFGSALQRGNSYNYFDFTAGDTLHNNLMDGVNTSWERIPEGKFIQEKINEILQSYDFLHPEKSIDALTDLYKSMSALADNNWKTIKLNELKNIIANCAGIFAEAYTGKEFAVQGEDIRVTSVIDKRIAANVTLQSIVINGETKTVTKFLVDNESFVSDFIVHIPDTMPVSQPYWLEKPLTGSSFDIADQTNIGKAESAPAFTVAYLLKVNDITFSITRPVIYKYVTGALGEVHEPLIVVPPVAVAVLPDVVLTHVLVNNVAKQVPDLNVSFESFIDKKNLSLKIQLYKGTERLYGRDTVCDLLPGKKYLFTIPFNDNRISGKNNLPATASITINTNGVEKSYSQNLKMIRYNHIPDVHYFKQEKVKFVNEEIKVTNSRVGYIAGAGDKVPEALLQLGYRLTLLKEADINEENLKQFDAVIAGIRAYNTLEYLNAKHDVLMNYVKNGGNYIVQYNQANNILSNNIGPYPFTTGRIRVTDENAAVTVVQPKSVVLNFPNKIAAADFKDWVQERSLYHAANVDGHYEAPLAMHDPNEENDTGSLITAKYGKGNFAYVGLSLFRQLPAGVAGAYRILANLIAMPKNKQN
ncbi:MAG: PIG-L family deacetylase [Chitinophagaceae bacterium]|jgi:LmbE family N-acetylglucosaminyl deacetylase|nr:PIG-L family deacetylase [Chitinophagaceae bacterium]